MDMFTISIAIFKSYSSHYQRVKCLSNPVYFTFQPKSDCNYIDKSRMLSIRLYVTNSYLKPWIHIQHRKAEEFPKIIEVSLYMLQSGALKMAKLVYMFYI